MVRANGEPTMVVQELIPARHVAQTLQAMFIWLVIQAQEPEQ